MVFICHSYGICAHKSIASLLMLTARQYGEVVLPDEAAGQSPGTLARKLSRCEEGMARVFAVMVQIFIEYWRGRGTSLISD
jgi:hypothetical protein